MVVEVFEFKEFKELRINLIVDVNHIHFNHDQPFTANGRSQLSHNAIGRAANLRQSAIGYRTDNIVY